MRVRGTALLVLATACWSFKPAEVAPQPKVVAMQHATCPRDAIVETVCGAVKDGSCKPRGDALLSIDISRLVVTKPDAPAGSPFQAEDRAIFRGFALDHDDTMRYRNELTSEDELTAKQIDKHCCYSRCTPLIVGRPTATRPTVPLPTPEVCFRPPPAGTTVVAPDDARCPHGVEIDGTLRPYAKTTDDECCYDMR